MKWGKKKENVQFCHVCVHKFSHKRLPFIYKCVLDKIGMYHLKIQLWDVSRRAQMHVMTHLPKLLEVNTSLMQTRTSSLKTFPTSSSPHPNFFLA